MLTTQKAVLGQIIPDYRLPFGESNVGFLQNIANTACNLKKKKDRQIKLCFDTTSMGPKIVMLVNVADIVTGFTTKAIKNL